MLRWPSWLAGKRERGEGERVREGGRVEWRKERLKKESGKKGESKKETPRGKGR